MIIFLIGCRGSGKTTVGKALAQHRGYAFADTDAIVVEQAGRPIADIVAAEGWAAFRTREEDALQSCIQPETVIATGGGSILSEKNRQAMRQSGLVFYLDTPIQILAKRLHADPQWQQRPSLTGKAVYEELAELLEQRDALYTSTAHHSISGAGSVAMLVARISELLPADSQEATEPIAF